MGRADYQPLFAICRVCVGRALCARRALYWFLCCGLAIGLGGCRCWAIGMHVGHECPTYLFAVRCIGFLCCGLAMGFGRGVGVGLLACMSGMNARPTCSPCGVLVFVCVVVWRWGLGGGWCWAVGMHVGHKCPTYLFAVRCIGFLCCGLVIGFGRGVMLGCWHTCRA